MKIIIGGGRWRRRRGAGAEARPQQKQQLALKLTHSLPSMEWVEVVRGGLLTGDEFNDDDVEWYSDDNGMEYSIE